MRGRLAFKGQVLTVLLVSVISSAAGAPRSESAAAAQRYIEKATAAIEAGHHSLGRSYLDAVVLSPWISPRQRARAYYFRGFSFFSQQLYVSAAQDYARALEFNPSQGAALSALSHMYAEELGLTRDTAEAFRLALKAARGGHVRAKVYLGVALLHGRGVERDVRKARFWLQSAADHEYAPAYVHLALTYRNGFADEPEPEIALSWYSRARDNGDSQATLAIAHMNLHNEFAQAQLAEAVRLFRLLANDGSGHAQAMLAHMYMTAQGVEGDYEMSRGLYDKAAEQGIVSAFVGLGHIYENGLGVAADKHAARSWYTRGAERGHAASQYQLGRVLYDASSLQTTVDALRWIELAAYQRHAEAQNTAAWILATSKFDAVRDGARALVYAELAVAQLENASTLDTLAAAYAEIGDYDRARVTQTSAIGRIDELPPGQHGALFEHRIHYESDQPWRE